MSDVKVDESGLVWSEFNLEYDLKTGDVAWDASARDRLTQTIAQPQIESLSFFLTRDEFNEYQRYGFWAVLAFLASVLCEDDEERAAVPHPPRCSFAFKGMRCEEPGEYSLPRGHMRVCDTHRCRRIDQATGRRCPNKCRTDKRDAAICDKCKRSSPARKRRRSWARHYMQSQRSNPSAEQDEEEEEGEEEDEGEEEAPSPKRQRVEEDPPPQTPSTPATPRTPLRKR